MTLNQVFHFFTSNIEQILNYSHWWNRHRIYSSLKYQTPMTRRLAI
ncbi:IS3 family transposase [Streptococcus halotolerans]